MLEKHLSVSTYNLQIFLLKEQAVKEGTKIYSHYTFEQEILKKDFIIMNQKSKWKVTNNAEKDFFKFLNNTT